MTGIVFRVDAGINIGLGHLQRCLSLASALRHYGVDCEFLSTGEPEVQNLVVENGFISNALEIDCLGSDIDFYQSMQLARQRYFEVILVDSYHISRGYISRLRDSGLVVVAIDDLAKFDSPAHLVINGGIHATSLPHGFVHPGTEMLLGPKYSMLREEFSKIGHREIKNVVAEVLVTMGGSDGMNLTPIIIKLLDFIEGDFGVTVVVGPFFRNVSEVLTAAEKSSRNVILAREPRSLKELMTKADIAISAGGQTLYELAATGTPTIAIQIADNQVAQMAEFGRIGTIIPLVFIDRSQLDIDLHNGIKKLLMSRDSRSLMAKAGQDLVDGKGTLRCAIAIQEMCKKTIHS